MTPPTATHARSEPRDHPRPLRDYALVADGERGALVGPDGDYVWLCAPRWDSPSLFGALIGAGGAYALAPTAPYVWGGHYEEGSLVWRSRWITRDAGGVECREALAFPGDPHRAVILRRVLAQEEPVAMRALLEPAGGFGHERVRDATLDEHGVWHARAGDLRLRWSGAAGAHFHDGRFTLDLRATPGRPADLVLEVSDRPFDGPPPDPDRAWRATEAAWRRAVPAISGTLADREARFAYAVMRGLTGSGGGMVAAATTSLPERAEEGRNYDYRYVWIRDQCYAGQAAAALGGCALLDDAVRFVSARLLADGPALAPAYTVDGLSIPGQRQLELPGYPGGFDIVGNRVNRQFQLDAFGECLLLLAAAARHDRLDAEGWKAARTAADAVARRWHEPDAGIWELDARAWTHSRLICAAGLRALAGATGAGAEAAGWSSLAERIVADTERHALHPSGRWQRSPEDEALDASLLLPALRGAIPGDDPRTVATLDAYRAALTDDHLAYRFRHDDRPLAQAEGAFVMCGFVMALAEGQQGRTTAAHRWFDRNRATCGPAGLHSEEYDAVQRQMRGNLPQAFVHAFLLESAVRLAQDGPAPGAPS
ncbi:glycoside hydrolase family 15 protein [Actinacidiphila guanduensis]|uniref:Glucoamylase (Glucan-1,4-alpha-glucosidase), GH15 family n=1 Tax=Actinacidiphila guanduensis TaxID=310781 RepID=A0A1H0Q3I2_9ACTN|nr:glycoside hydrolase family 15 protein [Actinacidiphila guanduensis]SDP11894.1 Glucoamylase (glucan-1,4-alpha-glucosidase), GH15 family [Actinacidiphila guanduensis]